MTTSLNPTQTNVPARLIVGVDYDATCRAAALHALTLAERFNIPVHLVHASRTPYAGHALTSQTQPIELGDHNLLHAIQHQETQRMKDFIAILTPYASITWSIESGDPKRVLLDESHKGTNAWVVLGARKHAALAEWFLGSTATYVIRHCQVPVLVVPPQSDLVQT